MGFRLSAITVLLAIVLSACVGSESSTSEPSTSETGTSAAGETASPEPAADVSTTTDEPAESQASSQSTAATTAEADADTPSDTTAENAASLPTCRGDSSGLTTGRTDVRPSGNRVAPGGTDLLSAPIATTELPGTPVWIVPFFAADELCEPHWYVTLEGGSAVTVDADGQVSDAGSPVSPPETSAAGVRNAHADLAQFESPLTDSRVVSFGQWTAALVDPTDRYGHGVLGDRIEAAGVEIIDTASGERTRIVIDEPSVIEGISPMLIDVDQADDSVAQVPEVLVTLSNREGGAWLALYNLDGTLRARSDAIGTGNRWRNQLGAGHVGSPLGTDQAFEIVDVRTPHLDGVVEFFRVEGDRLERVAATSGYTSHTIGSRNLDLGILLDADADKLLEVVLPTRDLGSLAVIDRQGDEAVELGRVDLNGSLNTNIATQWLVGQPWLALGTQDGRLLVFGDPTTTG